MPVNSNPCLTFASKGKGKVEGVELQKVVRSPQVSIQGPRGPQSDALAIRPRSQLPVRVSVWSELRTFD